MKLREFLLGESDDTHADGDRPVSARDGRPLNMYGGVVNGRRVTVYSSWRPGDPGREEAARNSNTRSNEPDNQHSKHPKQLRAALTSGAVRKERSKRWGYSPPTRERVT